MEAGTAMSACDCLRKFCLVHGRNLGFAEGRRHPLSRLWSWTKVSKAKPAENRGPPTRVEYSQFISHSYPLRLDSFSFWLSPELYGFHGNPVPSKIRELGPPETGGKEIYL